MVNKRGEFSLHMEMIVKAALIFLVLIIILLGLYFARDGGLITKLSELGSSIRSAFGLG